MKLSSVIAMLLMVGIMSAAYVLAQGGGIGIPVPNPNPVGRFQIVNANNGGTGTMWVIDTSTGDTWYRISTTATDWIYANNPESKPGRR